MLSGIFGYLIDYGDNIYSHRTFADTAAATGALMHPEIFVEILKLVVYPLAQPGSGVLARIMTGRVHGEIRELAVVPGAHPLTLEWRLVLNFVVDVKTMTGRAQEGADAATDTGPRHFFPQRRIEARLQFGRRPVRIIDLALRISHCVCMYLLQLLLVGSGRLGKQAAGCRHHRL